MINTVVKQRKDEKFDIWMYDGSNGNLLVRSDQGYERAIDAENIARRLAPAGEPMHLAVRYRDGTSKTETIRRDVALPEPNDRGGWDIPSCGQFKGVESTGDSVVSVEITDEGIEARTFGEMTPMEARLLASALLAAAAAAELGGAR